MTPNLQLRFESTVREFAPGITVMVGRDIHCTVVLDDERVSRRHVSFYVEDGVWVVTHLSRSNPTFVNGQPINTLTIHGPCVVHVSVQHTGPRIDVDLVTEPTREPEPVQPMQQVAMSQEAVVAAPLQSLPLRDIVAQRAQAAAQADPQKGLFAIERGREGWGYPRGVEVSG